MGAAVSKIWHCVCRAAQLAVLPLLFGACLVTAGFTPLAVLISICATALVAYSLNTLFGGRLKLPPSLFWTMLDKKIDRRFDQGSSQSPLLRLPLEIRTQIWQHVLGDHNTVYVDGGNGDRELAMIPCEEPSLNISLHTLRCVRGTGAMRVCRQMYTETDHLFYTTRMFFFKDQQSLTEFTDGLTVVQRHNIKVIYLRMPDIAFTHPVLMRHGSVARIISSLQEFPNLQHFNLRVDRSIWAGCDILAQAITRILQEVQVSRSMTATLAAPRCASNGVRWAFQEWPLEQRLQFTSTVVREMHRSARLRLDFRQEDEQAAPKCVFNFPIGR